MASDYIEVDRAKQLGGQLVRLANLIEEVRNLAAGLRDKADHNVADGPVYTDLETNFGLGTGDGGSVATLLLYMDEIFNSSTTVAGSDRLARLEEFVARIGGQ